MQLLIFNEEFLVSVCHQRTLITSLPFVHTARRSYRLNDPVRPPDCGNAAGSPAAMPREAVQTLSFRGRRSRNKVSVGEPAEGSLPVFPPAPMRTWASLPSSLFAERRQRRSVCWCVGLRGSSRHLCSRLCGRDAGTAVGFQCFVLKLDAAVLTTRFFGVCGVCPNGLLCSARAPSPLCEASHSRLVNTQLLSMDILALATMKNAAKCDT